jgi:Skp family chaperone for outer membrane proteins
MPACRGTARCRLALASSLLGALAMAAPAAAQPLALPLAPPSAQPAPRFPILLVNQDRLLSGSQRGQELLAAEEAARDRLRTEARTIETAFEAEERELTEARAGLEPEAFRALADAFDARVVTARRDQDARAAALAQEFDAGRRRFYAAIAPILVRLMERMGAQAILDETSVLIAAQDLDITEAAIAEIDAMPPEALPPGDEAPGGDTPGDETQGGAADPAIVQDTAGDAPADAPGAPQ